MPQTPSDTARLLAGMTDSRGSPLQVVRVPSPGKILNEDGEIVPASHMNFVIANGVVALNNVTLNVSSTGAGAIGNQYVLIANDGADAVSGEQLCRVQRQRNL